MRLSGRADLARGDIRADVCGRARSWDFPGNFFPHGISRLVEGRLVEGIKDRASQSPDT